LLKSGQLLLKSGQLLLKSGQLLLKSGQLLLDGEAINKYYFLVDKFNFMGVAEWHRKKHKTQIYWFRQIRW
jgi:hypothetical protein